MVRGFLSVGPMPSATQGPERVGSGAGHWTAEAKGAERNVPQI
jgi:hypothetical protein